MIKYELVGKTNDGCVFRPSAWTEMLIIGLDLFDAEVLIRYSNGTKSIVFFDILKTTHPDLHYRLLDFAKINNLKVVAT